VVGRIRVGRCADGAAPGPRGALYGGHPLACAAAVATIETYRDEGVIEHARRMGELVRPLLEELANRHPSIGEVRGLGLFWGLELVKDRATREPLVPFNASGPALAPISAMQKRAMERGLFLFAHWNVVVIAPPDHRGRVARGTGHPRRVPRLSQMPLSRHRRVLIPGGYGHTRCVHKAATGCAAHDPSIVVVRV